MEVKVYSFWSHKVSQRGFPSRITHVLYIFLDLFDILDEMNVLSPPDDNTHQMTRADKSHINVKQNVKSGKLFNFLII